MWHAVTPVTQGYDPVLCERQEPSNILVLNAGPGNIKARAWSQVQVYQQQPQIELEMRPGDQKILGGSLIRVHLDAGNFAAVAWRLLS